MEGHRDTVSCIATALVQSAVRASLTIVSSSWDRSLKSWDLESTGVLKTFDGHGGKVLSVALSSDGLYAASGSQDTTVRYAGLCSYAIHNYYCRMGCTYSRILLAYKYYKL